MSSPSTLPAADPVAGLLAVCRANAPEAAAALGRGLGGEYQVDVLGGEPLAMDEISARLHGPGLAITLAGDAGAGLLLIPAAQGFTPPWCQRPDPTGESRLMTLAQELGFVLLPEELAPDDSRTAYVPDLAAALRQAAPRGSAVQVRLLAKRLDAQSLLHLIWSVERPEAAFTVRPSAPAPAAAGRGAARVQIPEDLEAGLQLLPAYTRSLLKISVPVRVSLAAAAQPVRNILEIGPGTILQFEKPCEDTLALEIGRTPIAVGEAVKVGDKFGLRITAMTLPGERFLAVKGKARE